jgi:hypothetical protein
MTVFDWIAIIIVLGGTIAFTIVLLVIAWSVFEGTQLGEYILEKLKKDDEEE